MLDYSIAILFGEQAFAKGKLKKGVAPVIEGDDADGGAPEKRRDSDFRLFA